MTERFCGNCAHEGKGQVICTNCANCDDDYSGWEPLPDDRDAEIERLREAMLDDARTYTSHHRTWEHRSKQARRMAHEARGWRGQAETDAETIEEMKARLEIQGAELEARAEVITGLQAALVEMRGAVDAMKRYEYAVKNLAYNMEGCPTFGKDDCPEEPDDRDCSGCWARAATGETP